MTILDTEGLVFS